MAEFLATFQLVLIGTGSIVYAQETNQIGDLGIGLAFGAAVYIGIMLFVRISGAHMNPAVTIFGLLIREIKLKTAVYLICTQFVAALLASWVVKLFASAESTLGITRPYIGVGETWLLEFLLTFFLILTILIVYKKPYLVIALSVGTVIFLEAWLAGAYTGASMNPARSLGPAVLSGHMESLWIYLTAPTAAALPIFFIWKIVTKKD